MAQVPLKSQVTLSNGSGVVPQANVTDVDVACLGIWNVGGNHFGVTVEGVVLQLNGANDLELTPGGFETFTWWVAVAHGEPYEVTVLEQPPGLDCRIEDGTGVIDAASATDIELICVRDVQGLVGMDATTPSVYTKIDTADGATETVSTNLAFGDVAGLAYDPFDRRLLGVDLETDSLVAIDPVDGTSELVGDMGAVDVPAVRGLAFDADGGVLYGISSPAAGMCQLVRLDTSTGDATPVGGGLATGGGVCLGLAFEPFERVLYASTDMGELLTIDPATGSSTSSLAIGGGMAVSGLGCDPQEGVLLGISGQELVAIDPATGEATSRGTGAGFEALEGLAFAAELGESCSPPTSPCR